MPEVDLYSWQGIFITKVLGFIRFDDELDYNDFHIKVKELFSFLISVYFLAGIPIDAVLFEKDIITSVPIFFLPKPV